MANNYNNTTLGSYLAKQASIHGNNNISKQEKEELNKKQQIDERIREEARKISADLVKNDVDPELRERMFNGFMQECTTLTNRQFLTRLLQLYGFLTAEQREQVINRYVKHDGDIQIKYNNINKQLREKRAQKFRETIRNEEINKLTRDKTEALNMKALESQKFEGMIKAYMEAKEEAKNVEVVIREGEGKSKFGDLVNAKCSRKIMVISKNNEVAYIDPSIGRDLPGKAFNVKTPLDLKTKDTQISHSVESDDEWV